MTRPPLDQSNSTRQKAMKRGRGKLSLVAVAKLEDRSGCCSLAGSSSWSCLGHCTKGLAKSAAWVCERLSRSSKGSVGRPAKEHPLRNDPVELNFAEERPYPKLNSSACLDLRKHRRYLLDSVFCVLYRTVSRSVGLQLIADR